jgi:hypothetical protein
MLGVITFDHHAIDRGWEICAEHALYMGTWTGPQPRDPIYRQQHRLANPVKIPDIAIDMLETERGENDLRSFLHRQIRPAYSKRGI